MTQEAQWNPHTHHRQTPALNDNTVLEYFYLIQMNYRGIVKTLREFIVESSLLMGRLAPRSGVFLGKPSIWNKSRNTRPLMVTSMIFYSLRKGTSLF